MGVAGQLVGGTLDDAGAALPTVVTAMPLPRSMNELPSTSTITPPPAAAAYTGAPFAGSAARAPR
ncbi:hypothetical protein BN970_01170 [Mycolicibacterium conceptionense]|uniref:Uncharacterized protein n=1 Tax=Mycolicibacterium conceptionense TaxID=451644 RepID=A0A0U1D3C4_9MYCO|nr:hypothetical protein BN970_01170 [Mycolicibacterium conceptionense]